MSLTLAESQFALDRGSPFGDVFPLLTPQDGESLKAYFVSSPALPNLRARKNATLPASGHVCTRCGSSQMTRSGSCYLCLECGESSGCS